MATRKEDQERSQRFSHIPTQSADQSQRHFLSRGNSVSNIPWWVITLILIMIVFLSIFMIQFYDKIYH